MSWKKHCDICGEFIQKNYRTGNRYTASATLIVANFDDGYNTDRVDLTLDICEKCLMERFTKEELMTGYF